MQLDIFGDSRTVMLRNDVLDARHRRDAVSALQAWQRLAGEFPDDDTVAGLATLIDVLDSDVTTPFADHPALAAACCRRNDQVEPAARRLLGDARGQAWVASCWRTVAQQAAAAASVPAVHRILPLSLTFDHRVVTGGEAARFLAATMADLQMAR